MKRKGRQVQRWRERKEVKKGGIRVPARAPPAAAAALAVPPRAGPVAALAPLP